MPGDIVSRLHRALPQIREWIDQYILSHAASAQTIQSRPPLSSAFPPEILARARMVLVDRTPFPPVAQFGLPEFAEHASLQFDGITFKNTFFVVSGHVTTRLQFHELVHTVQWARLGVDRFLLAYAYGLLKFGYENSPLEKMAYGLELKFAEGSQPKNLVKVIEEASDEIWRQAVPEVGEADGPA